MLFVAPIAIGEDSNKRSFDWKSSIFLLLVVKVINFYRMIPLFSGLLFNNLLNLQAINLPMSKIFEYTLPYSMAREYLLFGFRQFYGEFIVNGKDNLPANDSAVIFAPNHLNALMDALAVSSLMPPRKAVVYLARADFFANKTLAKIMDFAKIMPAFRMRDGFENLGRNNQVFHKCIEVMRFGHAVCLMPEGGQGEERKIRPLVKGISRLAFEAQQEFGNDKKVKIVPVGIYLSDLIKTGKQIIINIGKPIDVQSYMDDYSKNQAIALNNIKNELHQKLSDLTLDLATSENYETFETITDIMAEEYVETTEKKNPTYEKFKLRQQAAKTLAKIEKDDPELMSDLSRLTSNYQALLKKLHFKSSIFSQLKSDETSTLRFLSLLITLPIALFGFLTNFLPTFVPVWIRKAVTIEYSGFHSSIQFGLGMILFPVFYILQALLFHATLSPNWGMTLIFLVLQFFTRQFTLKWYSNFRKYLHKLSFNSLLVAKLELSSILYRLIDTRNKIVHRINTKNRENQ